MDSPSFGSSAGSPSSNSSVTSSLDASTEQHQQQQKQRHSIKQAMTEGNGDMQIDDENTPISPSQQQQVKKRKNDDGKGQDNSKVDKSQNDKGKTHISSSGILQSSRHIDNIDSDSDIETIHVVASTTTTSISTASTNTSKDKQQQAAKRPKLESDEKKSSKGKEKEKISNKVDEKSEEAVPQSNVVFFKNGKLLLKQKKIDFAQQNAALMKRMQWNAYFQDVEEPLEEIPIEHLPLIALIVQENDKTATELAKTVKAALSPPLTGDEDSQEEKSIDKLPLTTISKAIANLAERINYGFRDNPSPSTADTPMTIDDSDEENNKAAPSSSSAKDSDLTSKRAEGRDLPQGYENVPNGLRVYRWEVKQDLRAEMFECLPKDMRDKIETRMQERLLAREETKRLFFAMPSAERKEILSKGVKGGKDDAGSSVGAGKKDKEAKAEKKSKVTSTITSNATKSKAKEDSRASSPSEEKKEKDKAKGGRKLKELTEEEKQAKEAEQAEKDRKKAEREAAKAEKEALKAAKDAVKAAKEEAQRKKEEAAKQQKNVFGAWLMKAGTSPVEAIPKPSSAGASVARPASSRASSSDRSSLPPASVNTDKFNKSSTKDYFSTFKPFFVRAGVEVAPINRFSPSTSRVKLESDDMDVDMAAEISKEESLKDLLARAAPERIPSTSRHQDIQPISSLMTSMQEYELQGDMDTYYKLRSQLRNAEKYPLKLLKFHQDVRPGYHGTWTKQSGRISGRNPYAKDEGLLDYDYDSEAEWEDDADGEDIKDSGDEEVLSGESEDDLDGWLAGDDEVEFEAGYDGEMLPSDGMDENNDPFALLQGGEGNNKKKSKKATTSKPTVRKKKLTGPLIPIIRGPYWDDEAEEADDETGLSKYMGGFKISWLGNNDVGTLNPFTFVEKKSKSTLASNVKLNNVAVSDQSASAAAPIGRPMQVKKSLVPEHHLAVFKAVVAASTSTTKPKLMDELFDALQADRKVNRAMISRTMDAIVDKKKKNVTAVKEDGKVEGLWEIVEDKTLTAASVIPA